MMHEPFAQAAGAQVEAVLRLPGDLPYPPREAFLPFGEVRSDPRLLAIMGGALDEYPARVAVAAFGDAGAFGFPAR